MAEIQLRDVSYVYTTPLSAPVHRLFQIRRERNLEDLPEESRKGVAALHDLNLTVADGQTYVVVGPSGCGKSTLLRVVGGIEKTYSGQVLYDGVDMRDIPPGERYIGMVFQNYALYPNFSNEGNLSFFFKMHEISDEETRHRIEYTSELMGIGFKELLPRRPGTLSGGEKQRVAIARAIVRAPKLFLMDEPLSSLDAKLRVKTRTEIKRLLHKFGITSIYVTHDQVEAVALADKIVVMHAGRIEQVGTYQEITDNPVNMFVAGFLGLPPMDLVSGGSISGGKLVLDEFAIPLPGRVYGLVENGQAVTLGLRRETAHVSAATPPASGIFLPAEVDAIEPDFVHQVQIIHVHTGRFEYSCVCPLERQLHMGQFIHVELDPERLYFFDTKSGKRL